VLVAECASTVAFMRQVLSLFGHEVGDHIRRGGKGGGNVTQLNMLAAEVDAHVNVAGGRFVGGVKCHGDGAFVVAEEHSRESLSEAKVTK
jgi:hypothetical protein